MTTHQIIGLVCSLLWGAAAAMRFKLGYSKTALLYAALAISSAWTGLIR